MSLSVELFDKARQVELVRFQRIPLVGTTKEELLRNFRPSSSLYGNLRKRYWDRMKSAEELGKYKVKDLVVHHCMGETVY